MSSVAIDLGHHQAFAALGGAKHPENAPIVQLGSAGDGLVVRWCEAGRPAERLHARLDRLVAEGNLRGASDTAAAIAECLAELLGPISDRPTVRLAVPVTASPGHHAHLRNAFINAGFAIDEHDLIARPYAALAHWLAADGHRRNGVPRGKTLILDNDSGSVSALVVDVARCNVLAEGQITTGPTPDPHAATLVLRRLLETAYGSLGDEPPVPWSVLSASIAEIVVSGSRADHPLFRRFIDERFPASTLHHPLAAGSEMVVRGLHHVDRFASYRSAWPTLDLRFDDRVVRPAGPWMLPDASPAVVPVGTLLGFGGAPVVLRQSATLPRRRRLGDRLPPSAAEVILADAALRIPERIGPFPLLRLHPSGSIEIRGTEASLRLHADWPVAGAPPRPVTVVVEDILDLTIDRSAFTPRDGPPHRATGES